MNKRPAPYGPGAIILVSHGVRAQPGSRLRAQIDNGGIPDHPDFGDISIPNHDIHFYSL